MSEQTKTAGILGCMFLSLGAFDGMLGVAWPSIRAELDRDIGDLGILLAFYLICSMAGSLLSSRLLGFWGLRHCLRYASALAVIGAIAVAMAPSWNLLMVAIMVRGLGNGAIHAFLNGYGAAVLNNRQLMAVHAMWGGGAAMAASSMTWLVTEQLPWQWNLMWCVVPACVAIVGYYFLPKAEGSDKSVKQGQLSRLDWFAIAGAGTYVAVEAQSVTGRSA